MYEWNSIYFFLCVVLTEQLDEPQEFAMKAPLEYFLLSGSL